MGRERSLILLPQRWLVPSRTRNHHSSTSPKSSRPAHQSPSPRRCSLSTCIRSSEPRESTNTTMARDSQKQRRPRKLSCEEGPDRDPSWTQSCYAFLNCHLLALSSTFTVSLTTSLGLQGERRAINVPLEKISAVINSKSRLSW